MSPIFAFFIMMLRRQSRDRGALFARLTVGFVLFLGVWIAELEATSRGAPGKAFFQWVIATNYLIVAIAALGIGSQAIAEEKEAGTLGLLRLTSLGPLSILLGKAGGSLVTLLLVVALQVPFTLLAVTLGGVSAREVFTAFALLASATIAMTSLGVIFSVMLSKVWRAVLMAFCFGLGLMLSPALLGMAASRLDPNSYDGAQLSQDEVAVRAGSSRLKEKMADTAWRAGAWIDSVLPTTQLLYIMSSRYGGLEITRGIVAQCLFGLVLFTGAWWIFPRFCEDESKYNDSDRGRPLRHRFARLRLPRPGLSAVYWKDFHFTFGGKMWFVARLFLYPALIGAIAWKAEPDDPLHFLGGPEIILAAGALWFDIAVLVCRSWSTELLDRNLPQLLLTPLSLRRLHFEKASAIAIAAIPPLMSIIAATAVGTRLPEYSETTWRSVQSTMLVAAESLFFFGICFGVSLRAGLAAIPVALIACVGERALAESVFIDMLNFLRRHVNVRANDFYGVTRSLEITVLILAAAIIFKLGQRHLLRRAAEL